VRRPRGVPRDEWMLAEGLTWNIRPGGFSSMMSTAVAGGDAVAERSAFMGAHEVVYGRRTTLYDEVDDLAAYAAGAALAMALESP